MKTKTGNSIIVAVHDPVFPVKGGGALRTLALARQLRNKNFEVALIAPQEINGRDEAGILRVGLAAPSKKYSQLLSTLKFNLLMLKRSWPLLRKTDRFLAHNTISAIFAPYLKKILRFDFVLDVTDIHAAYLLAEKNNPAKFLLARILLGYEYWVIKNARRLTVATLAMKKHLEQKGVGASRMMVVYDSVEKKDFPQHKDQGALMGVIHLGALDRQHNVEVLIRAIPLVAARFAGVKFFIVGGGRQEQSLKALADGLGVSANCIFTGSLDHEQAKKYLPCASIGVISRKDCLANRIVTTQKLFEYWASKTAVISTKLEGIAEIARPEKDILWFGSGDSQGLAEKINLLLSDPQYRLRLAEAGYLRSDEFNRGQAAQKIADFVTVTQD